MKPKLFVIGDVHGCFNTLMALIKKLPNDAKICFVGDLIDRGPRSMEVVEFVKNSGYDCVMGNHERMCIDWTGKFSDQLWLMNGGDKALDSYMRKENDPPFYEEVNQELFDEHRNWMASLPYYKEYKDYKTPNGKYVVVSHSYCINQWKSIQEGKDMEGHVIWNRAKHKLKDVDFVNFIGHTINPNPVINEKYVNVDTGAFMGAQGWKRFKKGNEGVLTAVDVETLDLVTQEYID